MEYQNTWFSKQPMTHYGCAFYNRTYWMHHYVNIIGGLAPMNRKNSDGSIDVLGVEITRVSSGISFGGALKSQQKSLAEHAEKLKAAGATIVKQTKNRLVARHGNEEAVYAISPLTSNTFYKHE